MYCMNWVVVCITLSNYTLEDEGPENSPPKTAGDQPAGQTADNEESKQKGVDMNGKPEASETENRPKSSGKRSQTPVNSCKW